MTEFHVEYRIEVNAETHEAAARKVARLLANGGARRGEYAVSVHSDVLQHVVASVDLGEIDGTWTDAPDDTDWVAEIDSVMQEIVESTEAGEMEAVFAARDGAYDLLARIRELMVVPGAS